MTTHNFGFYFTFGDGGKQDKIKRMNLTYEGTVSKEKSHTAVLFLLHSIQNIQSTGSLIVVLRAGKAQQRGRLRASVYSHHILVATVESNSVTVISRASDKKLKKK